MKTQPLPMLQEAFEAAPIGMLILDAGEDIIAVNRQLEQLLGYARAELIGQPVSRLLEGARDDALGTARDLSARHKAGHTVPVELARSPLRTPAGDFVLTTVVDLTERRGADDRFRLAIEAAPNGMMLVDEAGRIILVNRQIELLFGYARDELVGRAVEELVPARYRAGHAGSRASFHAHPEARPMGAGRELFAVRRDGREFPVEIGLSPLRTAKGLLVLSSIVDITERREAREQLQASLHEKEILLKELHHRAKNNLQLIASLLDLAQGSSHRDVLSECRDRINSIALVHEKLYQSGTFARIALEGYLQSLGEQVAHAWTRSARAPVTLEVQAEHVALPLDTAIPCGLVVNELITNAFKHAFPADRPGRIVVRARREDGRVTVSVSDDGVGLPPGPPPRGQIGLELVHALARQLRATIDFTPHGPGTHVVLTFPGGEP